MEEINTETIQPQLRKGILEMCILSAINTSKEAYVSDLIDALKSADMIVVEGTLYPLLSRLKKEGLLSYQWQESTQGPPRKYYALTADGRQALTDLDEAWNQLIRTVTLLQKETDLPQAKSTEPTNIPEIPTK